MKQFKMKGILFKCFILAGLLTACDNDQAIAPTSTAGVTVNDRNAKITPLTRLTKEGDVTVQYIKAGKFLGKVSKLSTGSNNNFNFEYSYDDNNPQGALWITRKQVKKSDGTVAYSSTYKVINGLCTFSTESNGNQYDYQYSPQGQLSEVKKFNNGAKIGSVNFSYDYNSATKSYRLHSLTELGGTNFELTYTYTSIPDKYSSRNPLISLSTAVEHGNMDAHLPIFGKFSDVLVDVKVGKFLSTPNVLHYYYSTYVTDSDGLIISKTLSTSSGNNPPGNFETRVLTYSDAWQGIP